MRGGIFMVYYFSSEKHDAHIDFSKKLSSFLNSADAFSHPIAVMCIGSDRSTGDSLGPLIGYKLKKAPQCGFYIYGDLMHPVHAGNLQLYIDKINETFVDPFIIAIDASLGREEHIGLITLGEGPLKPGLGVKKKLPEVGAVHITGIVNSSSNSNHSILQTTRLYLIIQLADVIFNALNALLISGNILIITPKTIA